MSPLRAFAPVVGVSLELAVLLHRVHHTYPFKIFTAPSPETWNHFSQLAACFSLAAFVGTAASLRKRAPRIALGVGVVIAPPRSFSQCGSKPNGTSHPTVAFYPPTSTTSNPKMPYAHSSPLQRRLSFSAWSPSLASRAPCTCSEGQPKARPNPALQRTRFARR